MRKSFLALLVLVVSAAWASSTAGADPGNRPASAIRATPITARQALLAASAPGAVTEVAPGLTLRQAVGITSLPAGASPASASTSIMTAASSCWNYGGNHQWDNYTGLWWQELDDSTSFCGSGGVLTYRSSHVSQYQQACEPTGAYGYRIAGGVGSAWVEWRDGGTWHCQSPYPWFSAYPNDYMDVYADGGGYYTIYEHN